MSFNNTQIIIITNDSEASETLTYSVGKRQLTLRYKSNPGKVYSIDGIHWADIVSLGNTAENLDSWGRALYAWKETRLKKSREEFRRATSRLTDSQRELWRRWLDDETTKE